MYKKLCENRSMKFFKNAFAGSKELETHRGGLWTTVPLCDAVEPSLCADCHRLNNCSTLLAKKPCSEKKKKEKEGKKPAAA